MKLRKKIGIILGLGVYLYLLNMNYGLYKNGHESLLLGIIMQFTAIGLCYGVYRTCIMKTWKEECDEIYREDNKDDTLSL